MDIISLLHWLASIFSIVFCVRVIMEISEKVQALFVRELFQLLKLVTVCTTVLGFFWLVTHTNLYM